MNPLEVAQQILDEELAEDAKALFKKNRDEKGVKGTAEEYHEDEEEKDVIDEEEHDAASIFNANVLAKMKEREEGAHEEDEGYHEGMHEMDHEEDEGYHEGMHEGAHEDEEEEGFTKEEIEELAQLIGSSITEKKKAKFADDDDEYESVHEGAHEEEEGMHEGEHEEEYDVDGVISDYNKSSVDSVAAVGRQISGRAKRGAAAGAGAQDKFVEKYTYEMGDEHVNALFEGEGLEEEFKFKAKTIFEAAVNDRVSEIQNELQESYSEWADLKVEKIRDGLVERVDSYLNYVIKEWMEENKLALENGIQNEINESFVNGIKTLFETHNINFPDTQMNVVEELETRVQAIEEEKQQLASYYDEKLNEELKNNISLNEEIEDLRRREIIREATEDIPLSQAERLENLAEGVDFVDEDSFARSMETLKENYFNRKASRSPIVDDLRVLKEEIVADEAENSINLTESMQAYSKALTRYGKD